MTDDRRLPPPIRTAPQGTLDTGAPESGAPESGARESDAPESGAPDSGDRSDAVVRDPTPREIMKLLHQLGSRLDRVEARLNTALSRRRPDAAKQDTTRTANGKPTEPAPLPQEAAAGMARAPRPKAVGDPIRKPQSTARHGLSPLMRDRAATDRLTRAPGLRAPVPDAEADVDSYAESGDLSLPGASASAPPVGAPQGSAAVSSGYTNRREPHPKRRGRLAIPLVLLVGLAAGGWWLASDRPSMDEVIETAYLQFDQLLYGPSNSSASAEGSGDSSFAIEEPAADRTLQDGADSATAGQTGWTTAQPQTPSQPPPQTAEQGLSDEGPAIEAAPRGEVGAQPLSSRDEDLSAAAALPDDATNTLRDLARRAANGDADAQHDLATAFALGQDMSQDLERAVFWYRQSAESGIPNALYNLGVLTRDGLGREASDSEAVTLFRRAAERNHPDAQLALGRMTLEGRGTEQDPVQAAGWFQAASAAGEPRGALELGRLFEAGLDGAADTAAAAGWYRIAADAGNESAEIALERLVGEAPEVPQASPDAPSVDDLPPAVAPANAEPVDDADSIRRIQTLLADLGYDPGAPDGIMGAMTRNAIETFQQDFSMPVTGEPSRGLIEDLEDARSQD